MENSKFKPVALPLKIDPVLHPACVERLLNIYIYNHTHTLALSAAPLQRGRTHLPSVSWIWH